MYAYISYLVSYLELNKYNFKSKLMKLFLKVGNYKLFQSIVCILVIFIKIIYVFISVFCQRKPINQIPYFLRQYLLVS